EIFDTIAACWRGYKRASAVTLSEIGDVNTGATSTVTTCSIASGSSFFAEQRTKDIAKTQRYKGTKAREQKTINRAPLCLCVSVSLWRLICAVLESPCQCLQLR